MEVSKNLYWTPILGYKSTNQLNHLPGAENEFIDHLFCNCPCMRELLLDATKELNGVIWKIQNSSIPTPSPQWWHQNRRCHGSHQQKFTYIVSCWGTHWSLLGSLAWQVWNERNRRLKQYTLKPPEIVCKNILRDVSIS